MACIHVVPGTAWIVEALAGLGVAAIAMAIGAAAGETLWRFNHRRTR